MQTIFLEFQHEGATGLAANGTDVVFHLDGRWSGQTRFDRVAERVAELRASSPRASAYRKQLFVGYTVSGRQGELHVKMHDNDAPAWAVGA